VRRPWKLPPREMTCCGNISRKTLIDARPCSMDCCPILLEPYEERSIPRRRNSGSQRLPNISTQRSDVAGTAAPSLSSKQYGPGHQKMRSHTWQSISHCEEDADGALVDFWVPVAVILLVYTTRQVQTKHMRNVWTTRHFLWQWCSVALVLLRVGGGGSQT
jgi:hypothetical protein